MIKTGVTWSSPAQRATFMCLPVWWLTNFFEICYEDQTKNKKFFYSYDGEGLRYEIQEFMSIIVNGRKSSYLLRRRKSIAIGRIIKAFKKKACLTDI